MFKRGRLFLAVATAVGLLAPAISAQANSDPGAASDGAAAALVTVNPVNVASKAGVYEYTRTFSVNPVDYNNDWVGKYADDFFFVRHDPQLGLCCLPMSTLYRDNSGGTYTNAATSMFGRTDKHGCAWGDYNRDGRPDMACAVGFGQNSKNELWRQNADGTFTNVAGTLGLNKNTHGRYRYVTFIDANNDAFPDLYFSRYYGPSVPWDPSSPSYYPGDTYPNELWINGGPTAGFQFHSAPGYGLNVLAGARKDAAACAQAIDFNGDGSQDLLECGEKALHLYRNNWPTASFTEVTSNFGIATRGIHDAAIADLNGDGVYEFIRLVAGNLSIYTRTSNLSPWSTRVYSLNLSQGESLAVGDFNGDGLKDLYIVCNIKPKYGDQPDYLVMQDLPLSFHAVNLGRVNGNGDDVGAIDYNRDGKADFIVSNGDRRHPGPVQLWTDGP